MPYKTKGKCVYRKDTGKKVGCTKGPVKKYLTALRIATANESLKTFKQFFYEQVDFNTLPDTPPYGFWVSVNKIIPVGSEGHVSAAVKYLGTNRELGQGSLYTQMYKKGFVRIVIVKEDDTMYVQSSKSTPNISARKLARDIGLYYGLQIEIDNDPLFESFDTNLPETAPYGFWIKYNEIIPVRGGPGAHWNTGKAYLLKKGIETSFIHEQMVKLGFVRCVFDIFDQTMEIDFKPGVTSRETIAKAESVADFYNFRTHLTAIKD